MQTFTKVDNTGKAHTFDLSAEDAIKYQGGTQADPYSGIKASGYTQVVQNTPATTTNNTAKTNSFADDFKAAVPNYNAYLNGSVMTSDPATNLMGMYRQEYDRYADEVAQRREQLEIERQQRVAEIENIFGTEQNRLEERQESDTATQEAVNFRLGVDKGTQYGVENLRQLNKEQEYQRSKLLQQKQDTINKINAAIASENFSLASNLRSEYKDLLQFEAGERDRQSKEYAAAFDRALLMQKETRQIKEDVYKDIERFTSLDMAFPTEDIQKYADVLGLSYDVMEQYVGIQLDMTAQENFTNQIESAGKIVDFLNKIPSGETFTFYNADGEPIEYSGMKTPTTRTYKEFNKGTNTTTYVTIDATTGEVMNTSTVSGLGTGYKGSTSSNSSRSTSSPGSDTNSGATPSYDEWVADQMGVNIDTTGIGVGMGALQAAKAGILGGLTEQDQAELKKVYEATYGQKAQDPNFKSNIKLTNAQYTKAYSQFKTNTGKTEQDFVNLSQDQKLDWLYFKASTNDNNNDDEEDGEYSEDDFIDR